MRGVFRTTKFASRADFDSGQPLAVSEVHNTFTAVGLEWMWGVMLHRVNDQLESARLLVGDGAREFDSGDTRLAGENTAQTDAEPPVLSLESDGSFARLTLRGTFGEPDANFEWLETGVVSAQGVLIDRAVGDQGRKVFGSIWVTEAQLEIGELGTN